MDFHSLSQVQIKLSPANTNDAVKTASCDDVTGRCHVRYRCDWTRVVCKHVSRLHATIIVVIGTRIDYVVSVVIVPNQVY